ncbi:MAG: SDR family oxidoreductase [Alphaproteobacteria bacterium]|nr:SDR family oxidoreductase [Alphaproteobacteria bacterium]
MRDSLSGKVALVTGGASGIGLACAQLFARRGAKVTIADLDGTLGAKAVRDIEAQGGSALFVETDVSQATDVVSLVEKTTMRFGGLDCAVNNAGIQGALKPTGECDDANWQAVIAVNLTGVFLCMKHEINRMLAQGGGAIVNVSSNFGLVGSVGMPAYSAAKHGVIGLSKTAALEYATKGVRVNAVCPGPIDTPMVDKIIRAQKEKGEQLLASVKSRLPMGRLGKSDEVAQAIVWLCSPEAAFVTGAVLSADGGFVAQ